MTPSPRASRLTELPLMLDAAAPLAEVLPEEDMLDGAGVAAPPWGPIGYVATAWPPSVSYTAESAVLDIDDVGPRRCPPL